MSNYLTHITRPFATDEAWTRYVVNTLDDEHVEVYVSTNDDGDTGYPGTYADWRLDFTGTGALDKALKHTGKSRQGVGHRVVVTVDGEPV